MWIVFGSIAIFTMLILPIHEHGVEGILIDEKPRTDFMPVGSDVYHAEP
jgi:hypothetical protein